MPRSVLVPVAKPPVRCEQPALVGEIAGAGPVAEAGIVQVEMDVGRPDTVAARCFGTKLGRNCDLVDFLRGRDEVRDNIFHKPLGEPDNACVHPLRMGEISRVVHLAYKILVRGEAAGWAYLVITVLADFDFCFINIFVCDIRFDFN